jgi:hypothetical protein
MANEEHLEILKRGVGTMNDDPGGLTPEAK